MTLLFDFKMMDGKVKLKMVTQDLQQRHHWSNEPEEVRKPEVGDHSSCMFFNILGRHANSSSFRWIILPKCGIYSVISRMLQFAVGLVPRFCFGFCTFDVIFFACHLDQRDSMGRDGLPDVLSSMGSKAVYEQGNIRVWERSESSDAGRWINLDRLSLVILRSTVRQVTNTCSTLTSFSRDSRKCVIFHQ